MRCSLPDRRRLRATRRGGRDETPSRLDAAGEGRTRRAVPLRRCAGSGAARGFGSRDTWTGASRPSSEAGACRSADGNIGLPASPRRRPARTARGPPVAALRIARSARLGVARGRLHPPDEGLSTAAFLALALGKPLLLEGAPGTGKTEAGKALAEVLGRDLVRLQCYEGMDSSAALYEWNYPAQMLELRRGGERSVDLYDEAFLIERPLLAALRAPAHTLLLIDEIDRSDHEFEAFLLEFLSDFQISIPEIGTLRAEAPPVVVLTSNRTRELHEAMRRRCVYDWIAYPEPEKEIEIVNLRAGDVALRTARAVVAAVGELREMPLAKAPGIAEAIDWAEAAEIIARSGTAWPLAFRRAIGAALKDEEDLRFADERLDKVLERATR